MKKIIFLLVSFVCVQINAQTDTRFWFVAPAINILHGGCGRIGGEPINFRFSTTIDSSTVVITQPANPAFTPITLSIPPNSTYSTKDLSPFINMLENVNLAGDNPNILGIYITASAPVTAYYEVGNCQSSEIYVLNGTAGLGDEFYIPGPSTDGSLYFFSSANMWGFPAYNRRRTFDIVATEDSTVVQITPTTPVFGGYPNIIHAGTFTKTLNMGQTYSCWVVDSTNMSRNFGSGSYVTSNKPIAITRTDDDQAVTTIVANPYNFYADLNGKQIVPINYIGSSYILNKGDLYVDSGGYDLAYITATLPNTKVTLTGANFTINEAAVFNFAAAGETHEIKIRNAFATANSVNQPFYVYQVTGTAEEDAAALLPPVDSCTGTSQVGFYRTGLFGLANQSFTIHLIIRANAFNPDPEKQFQFYINGVLNAAVTTLLNTTTVFKQVDPNWKAATIDLSSVTDTGQTMMITNTSARFLMGMINGVQSYTARAGYFAGFGDEGVKAYVVGGADTTYTVTCKDKSLRLVAFGGVSYKWYSLTSGYTIPASQVNKQNPLLEFSAGGIFKLKVVIGGVCDNLSDSVNITVNVDTGAVTPIASNIQACLNSTVPPFKVTNAGANTFFAWYTDTLYSPVATTSTNTSNTGKTASGQDIYFVKQAINSSSCLSNAAEVKLTISATINPVIPTFSAGPAIICTGDSNVVYTVKNDSNTIGYKWRYTGTGVTLSNDTSNSISIDFSANATSGVLWVVALSGCGKDSSSLNITVNSPTIGGTLHSDTTVCSGTNAVLSLSGKTGTVQKWQSSTNGTIWTNLFTDTLTVHTINNITQTTKYQVVVQNAGCSSVNSTVVTVTVQPLPVITSVSNPPSICDSGKVTLSATANAGTINWYTSSTAPASIDTGTTFITPTLTATTTYYVGAINAGCSSASRTAIKISQNNVPVITGITPAARCGSGFLTLGATATGSDTINWYATTSGGSSLGTGTTFTTPILSTTTEYYVSATNSGCTSISRTSVSAVINTLPDITGTAPSSICDSGKVTLGATANIGIINWYATNADTTILGTGATFITPIISATTTYYVGAASSGCTSASRTSITATVNKTPGITRITPSFICDSGNVTLGATVNTGIISWYASPTDTALLGTGTEFITPTITATTTYYVGALNSGCSTAFRTAVTASVYATPVIKGTTSSSICDTGIITLGATANKGIINWYASNTDSIILGTGTTFTTPILTTTTTYYVGAVDTGCATSVRTAVTGTVIERQWAGIAHTMSVCKGGGLYDLFQSLIDYSSGGIWEDINQTGLLSGNFFNSDSAQAGNYIFQYKVSSTPPCHADSVLLSLSVFTKMSPGSPVSTPYQICSVDTFDLFHALKGYDAGGLWVVDTLNYSIVKNLKDSMFAPQFLKGGRYQFIYYFPNNICNDSSTIVTILTDTIYPLIVCRKDTTISRVVGATDIPVTSNEYDPISVSDNCGKYLLTNNINDSSTLKGAEIPLTGSYAEITWMVKDYGDNVSECMFRITAMNIPNMFTPNGDGHNDTWEVTIDDNVKDPRIEIYDRWGIKVYSSSSRSISWNGDGYPNGTYRYIILDGNKFVLNGFITLVR